MTLTVCESLSSCDKSDSDIPSETSPLGHPLWDIPSGDDLCCTTTRKASFAGRVRGTMMRHLNPNVCSVGVAGLATAFACVESGHRSR